MPLHDVRTFQLSGISIKFGNSGFLCVSIYIYKKIDIPRIGFLNQLSLPVTVFEFGI